MTAIRYEVWTRQESGSFVRKFPIRGEVGAAFATDLFGRGSMSLPVNHPRLDDILSIDQSDRSNDEASVIRAYIGTTSFYDFYVESMELNFTDTGERVAIIDGAGRGSCLDRVRVRQYDWNVNPSVDPDWGYGVGKDLLNRSAVDAKLDWDFDDDDVEGWKTATRVGETNPVEGLIEITTDEAESGAKSLKFDPNGITDKWHSGVEKTINVDADGRRITVDAKLKSNTSGRRFVAYMIPDPKGSGTHHSANGYTFDGIYFIELDNVPRAAAKDGNPGGSTDGTWQDFALDVTLPEGQTRLTFGFIYDHHALPDNGPLAYLDTVLVTGNGIGLYEGGRDGWVSYGTMTTWELSTMPVSGNPAIKHTSLSTEEVGSGQYIQVVPGKTYTYKADIYHASGADRNYRIRVRTGDAQVFGTLLGFTDAAIPTAVATTITSPAVLIPAGVTRVVVDVLQTDLISFDWWLDLETPSFYNGLPAATVGKIMNDLLDDAGVDHSGDDRTALAWLTRTWTDALDSAGNAWDETVEIRIPRGQTYRAVVENFENMGYEFWIDVNPADETEWRLNIYNPDGLGTDHTTGDGPAVLSRPGLMAAGPFLRREPVASYAMVEGDELAWAEYRDTAIETAWGEIETYDGSRDSLSGTLSKQAIEIIDSDASESLVLSFSGHTLTPGIDYDVGDIIRVTIGDTFLVSSAFRVAAISVADNEVEPQFQVEFQPVT